jgi:hypothetical protein
VAVLFAPIALPAAVFGAGVLPVVWARVGGLVAVTFGAYYAAVYVGEAAAAAGRGGAAAAAVSPVALAFYTAPVWARAALALALAAVAAAGEVKGVYLLAAANGAGAASMAWALRRDGQRRRREGAAS